MSDGFSLWGIVSSIGILTGLGIGFGALLGAVSERFKGDEHPLVEQIDALLPQTQCGQCGYPGCRPYAEAINEGRRTQQVPARWRGHHSCLGRSTRP